MMSMQGDGGRRARTFETVDVSPAAGRVVGEVLEAGSALVIAPDSLAAAAPKAVALKAAPATRRTYAGSAWRRRRPPFGGTQTQ